MSENRDITLRPAAVDDYDLLFDVYTSTRSAEVAAFGWDEAQQLTFLRMQFEARQKAYEMQFPAADHSIIDFGELPAGRLVVGREKDKITLIDIAVLPAFQNNGIATRLIKNLQDEAAASGVPLVLRVDRANETATGFYGRLGFTIAAETDLLLEMTWISDK